MNKQLLERFASKPKPKELLISFNIICNAHKACSAFLEQFDFIRKHRKAKGTPTDAEQDLLRAMLMFACAGLDSMAKQLVRDALPQLIRNDAGAKAMFLDRTKKVLYKDNILNADLLLRAIVADIPHDVLVDELVNDLASGSLQSAEELFRVASYFDIPTSQLISDPGILKKVFHARNQITHEMDVDFTQTNRSRRPRTRVDMISNVELVFDVAESLLSRTEKKLSKSQH